MKIGDVIKIRNRVGILEIKIVDELNVKDINTGDAEEMAFCGKMRLEFHRYRDNLLVTLTEKQEEKKIVLLQYDFYCDEISGYLGEIQGTEKGIEEYKTLINDGDFEK